MKLGFIVNPIAGMGGRVALKGTDSLLTEAVLRGAKPVAPRRATEFLRKLENFSMETMSELWTCPGIMGEIETRKAGIRAKILPMRIEKETSAEDTREAVRLLVEKDVDLIVFCGGDGTARDIFDAMQIARPVPVMGVPSGVKMYSAIFAVNPTDAVEVIAAFAQKRAEIMDLEIMDADEQAIRSDIFAVKLYGFLKGPFLPGHIQGSKQVTPETTDEKDNQNAIARFIIEQTTLDATLILGPGTTVERVAELLGVKKTLLGVDIYTRGGVILDVDERRIMKEVEDWQKTWIVVSPIGHQGILLGRGNQQISPRIIRCVGKDHVIIAATRNKLQSIEGNVLRVDTGEAETDAVLRGYVRVATDYREWRLIRVE